MSAPNRQLPGQERAWAPVAGVGTEPPERVSTAAPIELVRTFAFVDLCKFTSYTDVHGAEAATEVLAAFRHETRLVAARRGVRVDKWLGDGVMLVGVDAAPVVAAVVEIIERIDTKVLGVRGGVATGVALLFDGDDYVGRVVNLASRLCDAAHRDEVLADTGSLDGLPGWIVASTHRPVRIRGIGTVKDVFRLTACPSVDVEILRLPEAGQPSSVT